MRKITVILAVMRKIAVMLAAIAILISGYLILNYTNAGISLYTRGLAIPENIKHDVFSGMKEGFSPYRYVKAHVSHVADGDTIQVEYKGRKHNVRLLYIDTPESVMPGVKPQAFSKEASSMAVRLMLHRKVVLLFEKGLRDRYGRLLAQVFLNNGTNIGAVLVRNGYARAVSFSPNTRYKAYYYKLEESALEEKRGMWRLPPGKRPFIPDGRGHFVPVH